MRFQFGLGAFMAVVVLLMLLSIVAFQFLRIAKAADWEARHQPEVNYHYHVGSIKNPEFAEVGPGLENVRTYIDILEVKVDQLESDLGQARKLEDADD